MLPSGKPRELKMKTVFRLLPVILLAAATAAFAAPPAADEPVSLDNPEKAAKKFEKAIEKAPDDWQSHYNLGLAYLKLEKFADAERVLRRAVELNAQSALPQAALGSALMKTGKPGDAITAYQKALELDPTRLDVQSNLGQAYFDAGKYDDAIEAYKGALKNKPSDPSSFYNNLGYAYLKKGDTPSAIKWFEKNVEAAPNSAVTYYNLGQMYRKAAADSGDAALWAKSADSLVKAADMDPKNILGLFLAGEALIMAKRDGEAMKYIDKYLAADPGGAKTGHKEVFELAQGYKKDLAGK